MRRVNKELNCSAGKYARRTVFKVRLKAIDRNLPIILNYIIISSLKLGIKSSEALERSWMKALEKPSFSA